MPVHVEVLTSLSHDARVRDPLPAAAVQREHVDMQLAAVRRIYAQLQANPAASSRTLRECRETIDRAFAALAAADERLKRG